MQNRNSHTARTEYRQTIGDHHYYYHYYYYYRVRRELSCECTLCTGDHRKCVTHMVRGRRPTYTVDGWRLTVTLHRHHHHHHPSFAVVAWPVIECNVQYNPCTHFQARA